MTTLPVMMILEVMKMINPDEMKIELGTGGEILGEVPMGMMTHTTLMDPPFTAKETIGVQNNRTDWKTYLCVMWPCKRNQKERK